MMLNSVIKDLYEVNIENQCTGCSLDSRRIIEGQMFIAFKGASSDGHDFVSEAIKRGASCVIGDRLGFECAVPYIYVDDVQSALWQIALVYRASIKAHFIALTGSVGKTTTKNMLNQILALSHKVHATAGNQNNEWGVPITVLNTPETADYAVVECGARRRGDIFKIMTMLKPQTVIITKIAESHMETFGSLDVIAAAKSEILHGEGRAFVNHNEHIQYGWQTKRDVYTVSNVAGQDGSYVINHDVLGYSIEMTINSQPIKCHTNIQYEHIAENAALAMRVCLELAINPLQIETALKHLAVSAGRMHQYSYGQINIIDDTYNASPLSVKAAIDSLRHYQGTTMIILGQMVELGEIEATAHQDIVAYARMRGIDHVVTYGDMYKGISAENVYHEIDDERLQMMIDQYSITTILIKGSRAMKMERFVNLLRDSLECEHG